MSSLSWQTIQAIATAYAVITTGNGYFTNLGNNVVTNRDEADDSAAQLTVALQRARWESMGSGLLLHTFEIVAEGFVPTTSGDQQAANDALDDLRRVFRDSVDLVLSGGATAEVESISGEIFPRAGGAAGMVAQVLLVANVREVLS